MRHPQRAPSGLMVDAGAASPLQIRGMTVAYGGKPALQDVDFTLYPGSMSVIAGPNGAGKSTLLKAALDIVPRVSGEVRVFGGTLDANRQRIAYVPQRAGVDWDFPVTVFDVAAMGLYRELHWWQRIDAAQRRRVMDCLAQVGMDGLAQRQIGELSGGQQQRVFMARALVQDAELYLLDEPFAGVDMATERALVTLLRHLNHEGRTVLCVHHDLATVPDYFDHVLLLNVRAIAAGPIGQTFTAEHLQAAYGGNLARAQMARIDEAVRGVHEDRR